MFGDRMHISTNCGHAPRQVGLLPEAGRNGGRRKKRPGSEGEEEKMGKRENGEKPWAVASGEGAGMNGVVG